ncbi:MAG: response regulator transcription factor, partial [Acidobacteria bacterium]|nr:response regulator transcription factor [Acidobacteriota bacterium]
MIRILLADDHSLVRQGLRRILESRADFQVVAEAGSGEEAVELALQHKPNVAVLDVGMKGMNGLEALDRIRKSRAPVSVLMLSMHADERYVRRAVRSGARGYLLKDCVEDELIQAILAVANGDTFLSSGMRPLLEERSVWVPPDQCPDDPFDLLTPRERHVFQLLGEGKSNKEVAAALDLSLHTVETHRARIMSKLSLHTTAEIVLNAVRRGLV